MQDEGIHAQGYMLMLLVHERKGFVKIWTMTLQDANLPELPQRE